MKKHTVILAFYLTLAGCATVPDDQPKTPPLANGKWVEINPADFVPPKARAFIKVEEVELQHIENNKQSDIQDSQDLPDVADSASKGVDE